MHWYTNKWLLLSMLALIWGSSFVLIKASLQSFSALHVGALRVAIAGFVLLFWGITALAKIPKRTLFWVFLSGLLGNFIPMFLFPFAELKVSSAMAGILNSMVPIFVVILGFLLFRIQSTRLQIIGIVVGFFGAFVMIYLGQGQAQTSNFWYAMLIVLATAMYATSGLIIKQYLTTIPSFRLSSAVFTIWFLPSVLILLFTDFLPELAMANQPLLGLTYVTILGVFGTALAMVLFYKLIQQTSTVFAASVTYLMPIVAVIWGIINHEALGWWHLVGGVLILLGVYLIREKN